MFRDLSQTKIGMGSKIREMKLNTQYLWLPEQTQVRQSNRGTSGEEKGGSHKWKRDLKRICIAYMREIAKNETEC